MYKVRDQLDGDHFYVLDMREGQTRKEKPFVTLTITADGKQKLTGNKWNHTLADIGCEVGDTIMVWGKVTEYEGALQIDFTDSIVLSSQPIQLHPTKEGMTIDIVRADFERIYKSIQVGSISQKLLAKFMASDLYEPYLLAPAAVSVHHAYECGLAEHSIYVADLAATRVEERHQNMAKAVGLLHDIGKIEAYEFKGPGVVETWKGEMLGHIVIGIQMLTPLLDGFNEDFCTLFMSAIASHHGKLEWGSPVVPKTPMAQAIHSADMFDSQTKLVLDKDPWEGWSNYDKKLGTKLWNF